MSNKKVIIVGAGPCGLSSLCSFARLQNNKNHIPEITCFEKQDDWGGLWNYTWRTGTDQYGENVHGSMYRYLWSNGPKECLEFADYTFDKHFGKPIPSFPPREVLKDYILGRAKELNVKKHIKFSHVVRGVYYDQSSDKFCVYVENLKTQEASHNFADYVIISSGHFSVPNIPEFQGIENFPGRVLHSHDFRDALEFAGKDIIVVGGSYSAEDIALQTLKYGAKSVTISYRTSAMGFDWPKGIVEVPEIVRVDKNNVIFKDGSSRQAEAIICCTGYLHHLPFMDGSLRLKTHNRLYPPKLYKGVLWESNPKLHYIGMQDQFYTFSMFDLQAYYSRDIIMGDLQVPTAKEIAQDIDSWVSREEALKDESEMIDFQTDYCKDIAKMVNYPRKDFDLAAELFKEWEHDKVDSIIGYRDKAFKSACTGTMGTVHHTKWWEAMDDSLETYLKNKQ